LARANEIANTQMLLGINKLSIRLFIPFVSCSLFRRIFGKCAAADILNIGSKRPPMQKLRGCQARPDVRFKVVFQGWVTFGEQKWSNSGERRGGRLIAVRI
jgi:hypothetical protein